MTKAKKPVKKTKSIIRKATLGATAAALVAGVGGQAQAWGVKDGLMDMGSAVGSAVKGTANVAVGAAALPFSMAAKMMNWCVKNPGKATAIGVGAVASAWLGLTYKQEIGEALTKAADAVSTKANSTYADAKVLLAPAGESISKFFSTGRTMANEYAEAVETQARSMVSKLPTLDELAVKVQSTNAAAFKLAGEKQAEFSEWWAKPGAIAAAKEQLTEAYSSLLRNGTSALETLQTKGAELRDVVQQNATLVAGKAKDAATAGAEMAKTPYGAVLTAKAIEEGFRTLNPFSMLGFSKKR